MQEGYEDALLGEVGTDYISDFAYGISEVTFIGTIKTGHQPIQKNEAWGNGASLHRNKVIRNASGDYETPTKHAKYPAKTSTWDTAEKNEFISRMHLSEEKQYKQAIGENRHTPPKQSSKEANSEYHHQIKGLYGPESIKGRRYGPNVKGIYGPNLTDNDIYNFNCE